MKQPKSFAERMVRQHGGVFANGGWCRASGLDEQPAQTLAAELRKWHYQVRAVAQTDDGKYEVLFR